MIYTMIDALDARYIWQDGEATLRPASRFGYLDDHSPCYLVVDDLWLPATGKGYTIANMCSL